MLNKEEWLDRFEKENGRKPKPNEFIDAKNNKEFEDNIISEQEKSSNEEPVLDIGTPILEEYHTEEFETENISYSKIYCFNCGQPNGQETETCISCGVKLNREKEIKLFFSDLTSRLKEVSVIATQKTKEFTQNAQVNTYIYTEKKKKENLLLALGNAYYEKYKDCTDVDFQEILHEIKKVDIIIKGIRDTNKI